MKKPKKPNKKTIIKGYCPEGHCLKEMELHFAKNWKRHIILNIVGFCSICESNYYYTT